MEPARQSDLRERNLAAVLGVLARSDEPVSRAGLADRTGLTRATVSSLVELLLADALVAESAPAPRTGAGRPAVGLSLSGHRVAALGAEIGVDYLAACVRDLTGAVRLREVVVGDNRRQPPEAVVARSAAVAGRLLEGARALGLDVVGATWAVPGLVDDARRRVLLAPNLGWSDVDLGALLAASPACAPLAGRPLAVDNEAALAALAEVGHPAPTAPEGLLVVSGEVGIGAGLVLQGRLSRGQHGWSGELGHVTVALDGPPCSCGATGCLEVYAGQEAVLRAAGRAGPPGTALGSGGGVLLELARAGDGPTLEALAVAGRALGAAVAGAVNLLDVDAVVLGGIYAPLGPWLLPSVQVEVDRRVLRARLLGVPVRTSTTGPDAAVLGAAASVLQDVLARPALAAAGVPA